MSLKSPGVFDPDGRAESGRPSELARRILEENLEAVWGVGRVGELAESHLDFERKLLSHKIEFLGWTRVFVALLTVCCGYLATRLSNELALVEWMALNATHAVSVLTIVGLLLLGLEAWAVSLLRRTRSPRQTPQLPGASHLLTALAMIIHPNFIFYRLSFWDEAIIDSPTATFPRLFNDYLFVFQATFLTALLLALLLRLSALGVFFQTRKNIFHRERPSPGWLIRCLIRDSPFTVYFTTFFVVLMWGVLVLDVLERFTFLQMPPNFPGQAVLFTTVIGTLFAAPFNRFVPQTYLGRTLIWGLSVGWWANFGFLVVCAKSYFQGAPPHPVSDKIQTNLEARGFYREEAQQFIGQFFKLKRLRSENTAAFKEFYQSDFSEARRRFREVLDDKRRHSQLPAEVVNSEVRELAALVARVKAKHNSW